MKLVNVRLGADPELFLVNEKSKQVRSAIGLIGGTKYEPRPIDKYGTAVQEDNVAIEFNIPPAKSKLEFIKNLSKPLNYLAKYVKDIHEDMGLLIAPSARFQRLELKDPRALALGCDEDYNAWENGKANPKPKATGKTKTLRTCGGHLHISWDSPNDLERMLMVKMLDLVAGVPSIFIDQDTERRRLYGKAGAHRPKEYGVEYRVLSNFWIRSPHAMGWMYDRAHQAVEFLRKGVDPERERKHILKAINENAAKPAVKLISKYGLENRIR